MNRLWSFWIAGALLALAGCPSPEHNPDADKDSGGVVVGDAGVDAGVLDATGTDRAGTDQQAGLDTAAGTDTSSTGDATSAGDGSAATDATSAGDSASARDIGGATDASTASDAASGVDSAPECASDRQCDLEEVCEGGACVPGCRVREDCPRERPVCDQSAGAIGVCVQCVLGTDCQAPFDRCEDHVCTRSCSQQNPCVPPLQCDTTLGYCVRCVEDVHCPTGSICLNHACVEGCNDDGNCALGEICDNHQCVAGCRAAPVDTCPENYHCDLASGFCALGCGTSSAQCPADHTCVANVCYDACTDSGDCPDGQHCDGTTCAAGCWDATAGEANCGFGQVCDQSDGACVDCYDGDASVCTSTGRLCDTVNRVCVIQCTNGTSTWACENMGWHCDPSRDNLCVECLDGDDCAPGATCDTAAGRCSAPAGRGLCATCDDDSQCGGAADLCVVVQHNLVTREQVCGVNCAGGQACPRGTSCQNVGDPVVRGRQCLPDNSVTGADTCAARLDLLAKQTCTRSWDCGLLIGDALCSGYGASAGLCSVACDMSVVNDCPEGFACEDPPPDGNRDPVPRCAPVP